MAILNPASRLDGEKRPIPGWRLVLLLLALALGGPVKAADANSSEYQVKAVLLFNLTQFVEWPESAFPDANAPVVIGILGKNDPFGKILDDVVRGEKVNGRPIRVERFQKVEDIKKCHVVFITEAEQKNVQKLFAKLGNEPVLTVADVEDFNSRGGMVSLFRNRENRIRLKINPEAVKAQNLSMSSKLLRVADIVR